MNDADPTPPYPTHREDLAGRVEKALAGFLADQRARLAVIDPVLQQVADVVEGFVLGGGKRLRPAFGWWGYRGAGGTDRDEVIAALAALELVQASALAHDDVIDGSDTRRGQPAVHRRFAATHRQERWAGSADAFGSAAAILVGDLCLAWSDALWQTSGLDPIQAARARPSFDQMRTELIAGQYLDVLSQASGESSVERAAAVARYKSAKYTVERPLLIGAALAGAPDHLMAGFAEFGLPLGEAFQLRDDLLGVFGDPAQTGKPAGDDLREGKRTYLVAVAVQAATPAQRHVLLAGLGDPGLEPDGVRRLREIIDEVEARARTEARIADLHAQALAALQRLELANGAAQVLHELAAAATVRLG